ncbi:DUF1194 domain-containing protein [Ostreiculturibacter nitratireducens]|uniref:DUF1194 domain-containing protein n=1 Tax=Ostreiculturibacter nitratireducens TaxID=3075226 RepID=UPI0031B62D45
MRGIAFLLALWPSLLWAECRQALAVGLDVSGSVDDAEYALQMGGLAGAIDHPEVRAALLQMPELPVWLAVYDWSGPEDIRLILPWTEVSGPLALDRIVAELRARPRMPGAPQTAVGAALRYGADLLADRDDCPRMTLDLTGDGLNNAGPRPRDIGLPPWVTVNALVIGADGDPSWDGGEPGMAELSAWFRADVIRGPDAFVETALGFEDFERAMVRKLLKELEGMRIGAAPVPRDEKG